MGTEGYLLHKALAKLGCSNTTSVSSHFSWPSGFQGKCSLCYEFPGLFFACVVCVHLHLQAFFSPFSLLKNIELHAFNDISFCICWLCSGLVAQFVI